MKMFQTERGHIVYEHLKVSNTELDSMLVAQEVDRQERLLMVQVRLLACNMEEETTK